VDETTGQACDSYLAHDTTSFNMREKRERIAQIAGLTQPFASQMVMILPRTKIESVSLILGLLI
jgi:hypothetical protein